MVDDRGMVIEVESVVCTRNVGRQMLRFIRAGILVCVVVVVVRVVGVVFFGVGDGDEVFRVWFWVGGRC